jgi:lipopolysaccharide export system protein LptC
VTADPNMNGDLRADPLDYASPRRMFKRRRNKGLILALKIVLPLIAVACVAYIVIWSRQVPIVHPIDVVANVNQQSAADVTVKQVKYDGVDAKNRPFSITAESAVQPQNPTPPPAPDKKSSSDEDNPSVPKSPPAPANTASNVINLKQLVADMTLTNGAWVAVTADDGIYHRDAGTVDLSGNVTLFHDTGLQFQTDAATVDLRNDIARGDQPVEGQNLDGQLVAQGFEVRDDGQTVVFTGRAYMKLYPKKTGASQSDGSNP